MNKKLKGSIFVFLGACSFGVLSTIVKTAYSHGYTLGEVTAAQTLLGMITLWIFFFIGKIRTGKNEKKEHTPYWQMLLAGACTGLVGIFYYKCVSLIPASVAIILLMQNVWMSIIIEKFLFKKNPGRKQIISVILVLAGTVLAAGIFKNGIEMDFRGLLYGLLAAFSYSIFMIANGRLGNDLSVSHKSALMVTGACLITMILFPPVTLAEKLISGGLLSWGYALALFGMIIPPFLFAKGVPMTGVALSAILGSAELPVAVLASSVFLKEDVSIVQLTGVVIILFAVIYPNSDFSRKAKLKSF